MIDRDQGAVVHNYGADKRLAIVMPVCNEADSIEDTVRELCDKIVSRMNNVDIWAFEDGSTDGTKEILKRLEMDFPNFNAVMGKDKKGYPRAMKEAFLSIKPYDYEYVMSIDSDGQYDPDDFFSLWEVMQNDSPDIVMGRRTRRAEPFYRRVLSWGLRVVEGFMFPLRCRDVTSVMRLMRVEVAHEISEEVNYSKYNFWLEFTARMSLKGFKIVEIPVSYRERSFGSSRVYNMKKMPEVILSEFRALRAVEAEVETSKPADSGTKQNG